MTLHGGSAQAACRDLFGAEWATRRYFLGPRRPFKRGQERGACPQKLPNVGRLPPDAGEVRVRCFRDLARRGRQISVHAVPSLRMLGEGSAAPNRPLRGA